MVYIRSATITFSNELANVFKLTYFRGFLIIKSNHLYTVLSTGSDLV